jgi:phage terminase small subunit
MSTAETNLQGIRVTLPQYDPSLKDSDGLTAKQRAFADHYIILNSTPQPGAPKRGFGTEACRLAGYQGSSESLAVYAFRLLRISNVREYIRRTLRLSVMSPDEVLGRLSKQARASIADVLTPEGEFNLKACKRRGTDDLLRKLKIKKTTRTDPVTKESVEEITHELELYNSQTALELMGKHHRLFADLVESVNVNLDLGRTELTVILQSSLSAGLDVIDVVPEVSETEKLP